MGFKILKDIEHIQTRPGMYIGSTFSPDHLAWEVIDNSLDELANGFANRITIDNLSPGNIIVTDNGRGIPIVKTDLVINDEEVDSVIAACCKLFSGAKFDESTYEFSIGLHGVGLTAVNALSLELKIFVRDRNNTKTIYFYSFKNSEFIEKQILEDTGNILWNTMVEFTIDPKYFTIHDFNTQKFIDRCCLVSSKIKNSEIYVNGTLIPKGTLEQFARMQLDITDETPLFYLNMNNFKEKIELFFTYDLDSNPSPDIKGDVNLHICGGTFQNNFMTILSRIGSRQNLTKNEIVSNLRAYCSVIMSNPTFNSQSKENMDTSLITIFDKYELEIEKTIKTNTYIKDCLNAIKNKKLLKKASSATQKQKRISAKNGFKDCRKTPGDIIYLMEGKSADGSLSQIRNSDTEAIFPISGKILNAAKAGLDKAINSDKFKFFLQVLGIQIGKKSTFKYKTIKILADADSDGLHISVLLIIGIWQYAPELIKEKRLIVILPPLYGAKKGGSFVPIYNQQDISAFESSGYNIIRFKGIGEMSPDQLEVVIRKFPREYTVLPPGNKNEENNIIACLTDSELKRSLCKDKRFGLSNLFEKLN